MICLGQKDQLLYVCVSKMKFGLFPNHHYAKNLERFLEKSLLFAHFCHMLVEGGGDDDVVFRLKIAQKLPHF